MRYCAGAKRKTRGSQSSGPRSTRAQASALAVLSRKCWGSFKGRIPWPEQRPPGCWNVGLELWASHTEGLCKIKTMLCKQRIIFLFLKNIPAASHQKCHPQHFLARAHFLPRGLPTNMHPCWPTRSSQHQTQGAFRQGALLPLSHPQGQALLEFFSNWSRLPDLQDPRRLPREEAAMSTNPTVPWFCPGGESVTGVMFTASVNDRKAVPSPICPAHGKHLVALC